MAIHDRHLDVHQNNVETTFSLLCCRGKSDGNVPIFCHYHLSPSFLEYAGNQPLVGRTILDQQNTTIEPTPNA